MAKLEIFDPALCCSTGVCGPSVDAELPRFAADLEWLRGQGTDVQRFNLAQEPDAFTANSVVLDALQRLGADCLPLILADGQLVADGTYPSRAELATFAGVALDESAPESPMEACTEALRAGNLLFITIPGGDAEANEAALRGVRDFQEDEAFAQAVRVVTVDLNAPDGQTFAGELGIAPEGELPLTLFIVPPNLVVGRYAGPTNKEALAESLQAALTRCQPGSGCCG